MKPQSSQEKLCDMTSSQNSSQTLLQEAQVQLDKKDQEVLQLKNSKQHLEKRNGGLRTCIRRASHQKDRAVEKAVEEERKHKTEFHTQEKGVITEASRVMMRDLVSLGVKANSVNAAVGCIAGHLGTKIEGKFTRRSTRRAVIEGRVASSMQIAEEIKSSEGTADSSMPVKIAHINF